MKYIKTIISLLAVLVLFAGCNILNEPEIGKPAGYNPASGEETALVRVKMDGNARTILPEITGGFSKFILSAEPGAGNPKTPPEPVEMGQDDYYGYISVPSGTWIFKITAYANISGVDYAVVSGSEILTVDNNQWYYNLRIFVNAPESGGSGTLAYSVNHPSGSQTTLKIESFPPGGGSAVFNQTVTGSGGIDLSSGIYFLTITGTSLGKPPVIQNEIVHIYPRFTSRVNYTFTKLDFGADSEWRILG